MNEQRNPQVVKGICTDCPFWDDLSGEASTGEVNPPQMSGICRRKSPSHIQDLDPAKVPDTLISGIRPGIWPITRATDFCGEHPLRVAAYQLGVEDLRGKIQEQEKERRKALAREERLVREQGGRVRSDTPHPAPVGGSSGSKR